MKPACLALRHHASPRGVLSKVHRSGPAVTSKVPLEKTPRCVLSQMEGCPGVFSQHLLQPQLIGRIQGALAGKADGHELGVVAVLRNRLADHGPLLHRGIVFVALERARILSDL